MATDCFEIPWRNVFANQTRPFPPRLPTWEFEPGWRTKPMAAVHHQRVCGASLGFQSRTCCRIMGKGIFGKMSVPEVLFSWMAFWMGEWLWIWVRSHLHFSPSQKNPPVPKTVWAWHVNTCIGNCGSHQPIPSPRASWNVGTDISNWCVHTGASQIFLQSHKSTGTWANVQMNTRALHLILLGLFLVTTSVLPGRAAAHGTSAKHPQNSTSWQGVCTWSSWTAGSWVLPQNLQVKMLKEMD